VEAVMPNVPVRSGRVVNSGEGVNGTRPACRATSGRMPG
jgi:hypothetical protein